MINYETKDIILELRTKKLFIEKNLLTFLTRLSLQFLLWKNKNS
jgi:hypothetical protein